MISRIYPHKLVKLNKKKYLDILDPDMNTLYFLVDSGEIFLGTLKLGAGFLYVDEEHPKPPMGTIGYFYIDRDSLDIYIWDNFNQKYEYIGAAGDNNVSLKVFTDFKDLVLEKLALNNRACVYIVSTYDALPTQGTENGFYIVTDEDNALYFWFENKKRYIKLITNDFIKKSEFEDYKNAINNKFVFITEKLDSDVVSKDEFENYKSEVDKLLEKLKGDVLSFQQVENKEDLPETGEPNRFYIVKNENNAIYYWDDETKTWYKIDYNYVDNDEFNKFKEEILKNIIDEANKKLQIVQSLSDLPQPGDEHVVYIVKDENNTIYLWDDETKSYIKPTARSEEYDHIFIDCGFADNSDNNQYSFILLAGQAQIRQTPPMFYSGYNRGDITQYDCGEINYNAKIEDQITVGYIRTQCIGEISEDACILSEVLYNDKTAYSNLSIMFQPLKGAPDKDGNFEEDGNLTYIIADRADTVTDGIVYKFAAPYNFIPDKYYAVWISSNGNTDIPIMNYTIGTNPKYGDLIYGYYKYTKDVVGDLTPNTFTYKGIEYTVDLLGLNTDGNPAIAVYKTLEGASSDVITHCKIDGAKDYINIIFDDENNVVANYDEELGMYLIDMDSAWYIEGKYTKHKVNLVIRSSDEADPEPEYYYTGHFV